MKYTATLTQKAFGDFKFLGNVEANSKSELIEKARQHCRSWNHFGRVTMEINDGRNVYNKSINV